jgi:hypothetical protein
LQLDIARPRYLDSPGYLEKRDRIFQAMGLSLRVGETKRRLGLNPSVYTNP